MKNKIFLTVLLLAAAVFLFTACTQNGNSSNSGGTTNNGGTSSGGGGGNNGGNTPQPAPLTLTPEQQKAYDDFIDATFKDASNGPINNVVIAGLVSEHNERIASLGIKIVDTTPSQDIAKGTTKEALKKRFNTEKL